MLSGGATSATLIPASGSPEAAAANNGAWWWEVSASRRGTTGDAAWFNVGRWSPPRS